MNQHLLSARVAVLVEGVSDQRAVEALARRRGRDLEAERVQIVPIGGAQAIRRTRSSDSALTASISVWRACATSAKRITSGGRSSGPVSAPASPVTHMEALGFFVCIADLEDELIRVLGPPRVEEIVEREGDLGSFRTLQKQPEWRGRETHDQLRRFMGSGGSRKIRYASLLVDALDLARVPRPLEGVLAHV